MRYAFIFFCLVAISCSGPAELKTGNWHGVIALQGKELPFTFDISKNGENWQANLHNDAERILLDEMTVTGDSVKIALHIFDAALHARIEGDRLTGTFVKFYAPEASLPFSATWGEDYRFTKDTSAPGVDFSGKYQLVFKTDGEPYASVGVFEQKGRHLTGTFLTPTGDYRYLEGDVVNDSLYLSAFDGNHAFVFTAGIQGDSIHGDFYSGKASHETFKGVKNENAVMPDPESLTYLKPGYDRIDFSFPGLDGKPVTPNDEAFKGKVLILQIFGTWCPNCMDETKFLTSWYKENHDRGVEIIGLAYERKDDFEYAKGRVSKMIAKLGVPYTFVIAGVNDKEKAAQTLPMLNHVLAFPTTIFIGRDGKVHHIQTGFEGPGTGVYHERFKKRFTDITNELLTPAEALKP